MSGLVLPSVSGWYGPTEPGWPVCVMDGARPRKLTKKPLLVGASLHKAQSKKLGPLSGDIARNLSLTLGVTYETFLCLFDRVNLLSAWKEEFMPRMSTLRLLAAQLGDEPNGVPVIYLGRRVAEAFGFFKRRYEWDRDATPPSVAIADPQRVRPERNTSDLEAVVKIGDVLREALLYHGRLFRIGDYPNGRGSMVMIQRGAVWGDAARRLKHRQQS